LDYDIIKIPKIPKIPKKLALLTGRGAAPTLLTGARLAYRRGGHSADRRALC
jgi:hypothetical protein